MPKKSIFALFSVQNWDVSFLFHSFIFLDSFSVRIGGPLLPRIPFYYLFKQFISSEFLLNVDPKLFVFGIIFNPFVTNASFLWCFQGIEKWCIGNKWVNEISCLFNQSCNYFLTVNGVLSRRSSFHQHYFCLYKLT